MLNFAFSLSILELWFLGYGCLTVLVFKLLNK